MSGQTNKPPDDEAAQDFIELHQGSYWRARRRMKETASGDKIPKGRMLMLESIRDVDQQAHTIILRGHPSEFKEHYTDVQYRFLVQDFLDGFELVPEDEARAIRQQELAGVQQEVQDIQERIALAARNPETMKDHVDAGVKEWEKEQKLKIGSTAALPVPNSTESVSLVGLDATRVDNMKLALRRVGKVAELQGEWMKQQSTALATRIKEMTPYFAEAAAAALAKTEDVRAKIEKLYRGIASLDLYVGKDVDVVEIRRGESAPPEEPLTVKQSKLYMDEEISVWADVDENFDFHNVDIFLKKLAESKTLADQLFPTQRSLICMAVRRENKDYGTTDPWAAARMNERNKAVFLLVRDGENIFQVWSPVESHLRAGRLFPTRREIDEIFEEQGFWNFKTDSRETEQINFMDTRYTDKLSEHEMVALHYKRFLILMAGLDHRLDLFGRFYPEPKGMNFVSQRFVQKYMVMLSDEATDAPQLTGDVLPDFSEWITSRNEYLRSGSRVMGFWRNCMTVEAAPGVWERESYHRDRPTRQYDSVDDFSVIVAFREGKNILAKVPVEGKTQVEYKDRTFDATVNLSIYSGHHFGFLVLDAVKAADLDYYIHSRIERRNHVAYIRLFKHAAEYLRKEEQAEAAPRAAMMKALADGGIAEGAEAEQIVDKAVIAYRAAKRGAALPQVPDRPLLDQMFEISRGDRRIEQAENYALDNHLTPLRLTVTGKSVLHLYCAPHPDERDDRLYPHAWVKCLTLYAQKKGLGLSNTTWKTLPLKDASETVLKEWPVAAEWAGKVSPVRYEEKQRWLKIIDDSRTGKAADFITRPLSADEWEHRFRAWRLKRESMQEAMRRRVVVNPGLVIPVALTYKQPGEDGEAPTLKILCIGTSNVEYWLYHSAPTPELKAALVHEYSDVYNLKQAARDRLKESKGPKITLHTLNPEQLDRIGEYGLMDEKDISGTRTMSVDENGADLNVILEKLQAEHKRYHSRPLVFVIGKGWEDWTNPGASE